MIQFTADSHHCIYFLTDFPIYNFGGVGGGFFHLFSFFFNSPPPPSLPSPPHSQKKFVFLLTIYIAAFLKGIPSPEKKKKKIPFGSGSDSGRFVICVVM